MRKELDPLLLKKGATVYIEMSGQSSVSNYKYSVKTDAKPWKGDDVYVKVSAEETLGGSRITAARRNDLNLPVDTFRSTTRFYNEVCTSGFVLSLSRLWLALTTLIS